MTCRKKKHKCNEKCACASQEWLDENIYECNKIVPNKNHESLLNQEEDIVEFNIGSKTWSPNVSLSEKELKWQNLQTRKRERAGQKMIKYNKKPVQYINGMSKRALKRQKKLNSTGIQWLEVSIPSIEQYKTPESGGITFFLKSLWK